MLLSWQGEVPTLLPYYYIRGVFAQHEAKSFGERIPTLSPQHEETPPTHCTIEMGSLLARAFRVICGGFRAEVGPNLASKSLCILKELKLHLTVALQVGESV